ncbi:hypothetical protein DEO72_LG5g956 [Vigna unguiculata]|uniref:Uncharacterized protein n=1 Tax=Vigna unguiculata TaxID=3917 RepID=A0A4D6LW30_VIGUN|nr:hypothetical protein DEO72_LG5g956 [Vigna unguiculata]
MVSTAWWHGGWPPGASAVAEMLQAEVLCAEYALYYHGAWRWDLDHQVVAGSQWGLGAWCAGGGGSFARRSLLREKFKGTVRLTVHDTRQAV